MTKNQVGERFILGFRGDQVPFWLKEFSGTYGLGGLLLFDYDCLAKKYERNIYNPEQLKNLCKEIHDLPSRPLVFVDQEGGKVRRLKEKYGFAPLVSAKQFANLTEHEAVQMLDQSFSEMKSIGVDVNLAPVVDVDDNPLNPDIGAVERSFSADIKTVQRSAELYSQAGRRAGLGLCLKHFPGMGGAHVNAHHDLTNISDSFQESRCLIFKEVVQNLPGKMILLSHGIIDQWEENIPVSMSKVALQKVRSWDSEIITITDDLQMQGLQKVMTTKQACVKATQAGVDFLCIGNNLIDEQEASFEFAEALVNLPNQTQSLSKIADLKRKLRL